MQTFFAANNLIIESDDAQWQLKSRPSGEPMQSASGSGQFLVQAGADGLHYHPTFASARRLPEAGLKPYQIEMVIVGWENSVWQLGVLLAPHLASQRGGRWCGIAKWVDDAANQTIQAETARRAGEMLAIALQKPFQFVPAVKEGPDLPAPGYGESPSPGVTPERVSPLVSPGAYSAGPVTATRSLLSPIERSDTASGAVENALPPLPNAAPATLPLISGEWALSEIGMGLRWQRSPAWKRAIFLRGLFFAALAVIFAYLAIGELRSAFAPVQPDWLPIMGIIVMIIMIVQSLLRFAALWTTSSIEFDRRNRLVRIIRRPTGVIRQIPFEKIEYVLITEQVMRRARTAPLGETAEIERTTGEAWIHLKRDKGDYIPVAYLPEVDGQTVQPVGSLRPFRRQLSPATTDCTAFLAAIRMAEMIEIPAYLEEKR